MLPDGDLLGGCSGVNGERVTFYINLRLWSHLHRNISISVYICIHLLEPIENFKELLRNRMLFRDPEL